jgi:ABC-2 type transport system permease protein
MLMRVIGSSVQAQVQMTRRNIEDLLPVLTMPVFALVFMAVFRHSGRDDLAGYALMAPLLLTVGQMGMFVASEILARERGSQTLELLIATPSPFFLVLFPRIAVLSSIGLLGFAEGWLALRIVFDVNVTIHHPGVLVATIVLTVFASACTALITAALFCLSGTVRTFQVSISYPVFILGGVIVPINFLPDWVQPLSRVVFLYWAAELLRDSMKSVAPDDVLLRLGAILALSLGALAAGGLLIGRMLDNLRRQGTLGLS